jgi:hypothetical protein
MTAASQTKLSILGPLALADDAKKSERRQDTDAMLTAHRLLGFTYSRMCPLDNIDCWNLFWADRHRPSIRVTVMFWQIAAALAD